MKAYIKDISYYLPEKIVTNEQLIEMFPEWTVEKIASKIGINQRHIAAENETALDMSVKAAENLFKENNFNRSEIDFVLLCTQSPDYFLPTSACIIQDKLGLSTRCGAIDYNLGCSGYVYGLSLAKGLIAGGIAKNILLLTSETYSKHIHEKDKGNMTIFGDAASASLISTEGFAEIGNFSLGTNGRGAENLIVRTGGIRTKNSLNDLIFDDSGNPKSSDYLSMNGGEIFNFTVSVIPQLVEEVLGANKLKSKDEIDMFVFHQANKYMLNFLRKMLNIDNNKFYVNLEKIGNTVSSTIPIALFDAHKLNLLSGNVMLAGFGVGYSWAGVVLKF